MKELDRETARRLLPRRPEKGQKWAFGRTLLVCGSAAMPGAAVLAGLGALRSGVGLVQLATVEEAAAAARIWLPEALLLSLTRREGLPGGIARENAGRLLEQGTRANSLLFGCGVGRSEDGAALLERLCGGFSGTVVLDADGLNLLAEEPELLRQLRHRAVLTPHIGEFCRLSGRSREKVEAGPEEAAEAFAREWGCVVVLKGAGTVVTDGQRGFVLEGANSGMAKGGSGDLLAGLTAGLCALRQGRLTECAALAVWLHHRAGVLARQRMGAFAMLPRDVAEALAGAFAELEEAYDPAGTAEP